MAYALLVSELNSLLDGIAKIAWGYEEGLADRNTGATALVTANLSGLSSLNTASTLGSASLYIQSGVGNQQVFTSLFSNWFAQLQYVINGLIAQGGSGYSNLETYLTWLNIGAGVVGGSYFTALQHPGIQLIQNYLGANPNPLNYYYVQPNLASYTTAGGYVAGTPVNQANYAGGIPTIVVSASGVTPQTVTVTGTAADPVSGTFVTGKTWTATFAAAGTYTLAPGGGNPATAGSLIAAVSGITVAGGTLANFTIGSTTPVGRTVISWQ